MTEAEWLTAADPSPMLELLQDRASDRQVRLFAVACCRGIGHLLALDESRRAVEIAELAADMTSPAPLAWHRGAATIGDGYAREGGPTAETDWLVYAGALGRGFTASRPTRLLGGPNR
jgi:hypothetical protein